MSAFLQSSYSYDPAGVPYILAGLMSIGMATGLVLYERFTAASRHFFALAAVMAGWLLAYGASYMADSGPLVQLWYRLGLALTALGVPLVYRLALHLTGRRRPRLQVAIWMGGVVMAAVAAGPLAAGISQLLSGSLLAGWGPLAALYVGYLAAALALVIHEFWQAFRLAPGPAERRRHLTMLLAIAVAGVGLVDFFVPARVTMPSGVAPLAMALSLAIMGLAGTRYRTFSASARFATDEVLRAMGDAVLVCDANGTVRVANAEARRLLGAPDGVLLGSHVLRWLRGAGGAESSVASDESVSSLALVRDRKMLLRPQTGEPIDVSVSIEPITAGGERRGLVIVARDIRDRVNSERALQAAERRYRSLFWHNPGPAYEIDLEGRIQAVNPAAERLVGLTAEDLSGRPFAELIAPDELEKVMGVFRSVLRGEAREYETRVLTAPGEERELHGMSIPILEDGEIVGVFGVGLDMSEAARAKRELEVQRRYFADLFENSPEGIVLVEAATDRVHRVNKEFTRMFGWTAEEAVGRDLNELIVPEELREEGSQMSHAVRDADRLGMETVRRAKDGTRIEVSVLARELKIPGQPLQLYGVYRDISDRKKTERALREREEELRHAHKMEAVGKLAGGIAHDFNNLVTVINGHARFALEEAGPGSSLEGDLLEIEKAGARAADLTQQLLAYSRRQVLRPQALDPNVVILELHGMLRRLIGEHIEVETDLAPDGTRVRADRGQLEQVLVNLVVNARDAMPEGGTLTLSAEVLALEPGDRRLDAWAVPTGRYVRMGVTDTGVGMGPETLDRAFEPFFTTKEQGKGTGLGLSTAFGIIKQSGGHMCAASQPGEGTRFDVILPVSDLMSPPAADPPERTGPYEGATILVVEDEAAVRKLVVRVLERQGCTVLAAANGRAALELVEGHEGVLDLVITDLVMPEMGGHELAEHLRGRSSELPILFMSGYDEELVGGAGTEWGFVGKPFAPSELIRHVGEALSPGPSDAGGFSGA